MHPYLSRARAAAVRRVVVLTGAGVSVASGLPTYRGTGGLWTRGEASIDSITFGAPWESVWRTLGPLRTAAAQATPNAAHLALAMLEQRMTPPDRSLVVITQNVDGLHRRAGSRNLVELHGSLFRTRCTACAYARSDDAEPHDRPPPCPRCGAPLRPDVVLFNEAIGADEEWACKKAFESCDVFVAIGTSGTVWPAAGFVRHAAFHGARTVWIGLEAGNAHGFDEVIEGKAEELVPALVKMLTEAWSTPTATG